MKLERAASRAGLAPAEYLDQLNKGLRYCCACRDWHPHSEFNRNKRGRDGLQSSCRNAHRSPWWDMGTQIYAILDEAGAIRYIGKTKLTLEYRIALHWGTRKVKVTGAGDTPFYAWLRTLNAPPTGKVLVVVEDSAVRARPRKFNAEMRAIRAAANRWPGQLLNLQDGRNDFINWPSIDSLWNRWRTHLKAVAASDWEQGALFNDEEVAA